jgi:hypothetical protein
MTVDLDSAAMEVAARVLCDEGILALDGSYATWERHADSFRGMAQRVVGAYLANAPMSEKERS